MISCHIQFVGKHLIGIINQLSEMLSLLLVPQPGLHQTISDSAKAKRASPLCPVNKLYGPSPSGESKVSSLEVWRSINKAYPGSSPHLLRGTGSWASELHVAHFEVPCRPCIFP
jgi:hypothetical protein